MVLTCVGSRVKKLSNLSINASVVWPKLLNNNCFAKDIAFLKKHIKNRTKSLKTGR